MVVPALENLLYLKKYLHLPNRKSNRLKEYNNNINQNSIKKIWQRNFYEHIIRSVDDYNRIAEYIKNNPINWKHDDFNNDGINN